MSDELKAQISQNMKDAMRSKDKERLSVIRMLMAAIKQVEVDDRTTLNDEDILRVINKMIKQRKDAAQQFSDAGRNELADKELFEIKTLQEYLPPQLDIEEIQKIVKSAIADTNATSIKDMGKVMGMIKPKLQGRADMGEVSELIKSTLSQ